MQRQFGRATGRQRQLRPPEAQVPPAGPVAEEEAQRGIVRRDPHHAGGGGAGDHERREVALVGGPVDLVVVRVGTAVAVIVVAIGQHHDAVVTAATISIARRQAEGCQKGHPP